MTKRFLLLKDANVSKIQFSENGKDLTVIFSDMTEGKDCASLFLEKVVLFYLQNSFDDDYCFPIYVGEVVCEEIESKNIRNHLNKANYGFFDKDDNLFMPQFNEFYTLCLEGGEISIKVICGKYTYTVYASS